jgi:hypothetical protein
LDYGRDEVDKIVREVGSQWWDVAREATPPLLEQAIRDQATLGSVDRGYLRWVLLHHRASWDKFDTSGMLGAAIHLFLASVTKDRSTVPYTVPSDMASEQRVNKALQGLAKWANGPFADAIGKTLAGLIRSEGEKIKAAILSDTGEKFSTQQARMVIVVELPERIRDHPFWFRDPITLGVMAKGIIG